LTPSRPISLSFPLVRGPAEAYLYALAGAAEKPLRRRLERAFRHAERQGCAFFALPENFKAPKDIPSLRDGTIFRLCALPLLLEEDLGKNFRRDLLAIETSDRLMIQAARILARECRRLHILGERNNLNEDLARIIYEESGLICTIGKTCPQNTTLILPPQYHGPGWRDFAILPAAKEKIPLPWAEALLLDNTEKANLAAFLKADLHQKRKILLAEAKAQGINIR